MHPEMNIILVCLVQFYTQNIRLFTNLMISKIALFSVSEHFENTVGWVGCCILRLYVYDRMVCWSRLSPTELKKTTHVSRQVHFLLQQH